MITLRRINNLNRNSCDIIDLTMMYQKNPFSILSPYYLHGGIPVPYTYNTYLNSVRDVWCALRTARGVNSSKTNPNDFKFRKGLNANDYWTYKEARKKILIPLYCWMLEEKAFNMVNYLRSIFQSQPIIIADFTINSDIENTDEALSFAYLLKSYIEGSGPYKGAVEEKIKYQYITVGQREGYLKKSIIDYPKIANIDTNLQRSIDFNQ